MNLQVIKIMTRYEVAEGKLEDVILQIAEDIKAKRAKDPENFKLSMDLHREFEKARKAAPSNNIENTGMLSYASDLYMIGQLLVTPAANTMFLANCKWHAIEILTPENILAELKDMQEHLKAKNTQEE